jgi:hypothetical protein
MELFKGNGIRDENRRKNFPTTMVYFPGVSSVSVGPAHL